VSKVMTDPSTEFAGAVSELSSAKCEAESRSSKTKDSDKDGEHHARGRGPSQPADDVSASGAKVQCRGAKYSRGNYRDTPGPLGAAKANLPDLVTFAYIYAHKRIQLSTVHARCGALQRRTSPLRMEGANEEGDDETAKYAKLASQARHDSEAPNETIYLRCVVANKKRL
jgi:hypothetical protein